MEINGIVTIHYAYNKEKPGLKILKFVANGVELTPIPTIKAKELSGVPLSGSNFHQIIYHHSSPGMVTYYLPDGSVYQFPIPQ